jgi:hypothetical protein
MIHRSAAAVAVVVALTVAFTGLLRSAPAPAAAFCPGGDQADPAVILCDDFEDPASLLLWEIDSNKNAWRRTQFVQCTDERFGFGDRCAAWTNRLVFDGEWGYYGYDARRSFVPQSEFYVRWYQWISEQYHWGTLEDKSVILHDHARSISAYVATSRNQQPEIANSGPGVPFVANYQDLDWRDTDGQFTNVNRFQNQGRDLTLERGKWYLFEWYVKLNTPGEADGVTKLWIDDATQPIAEQTLRMHHTNLRWLRKADGAKQFGTVRLTVYHQRCDRPRHTCPPVGPAILDQSHRWDQIVISRNPIGPVPARTVRRRWWPPGVSFR